MFTFYDDFTTLYWIVNYFTAAPNACLKRLTIYYYAVFVNFPRQKVLAMILESYYCSFHGYFNSTLKHSPSATLNAPTKLCPW